MQDKTSVTTFLFTDIEGSTRMWDQSPERMQAALACHDALARDAVQSHRGDIVKMTGDGIHAAFTDPLDAVLASIAFQQALARPGATGDIELRTRSGIHVGLVERRDRDFFGSPVNRAARIMSAAHGGQILLSQTTVDFIGNRLPEEIALRDLGEVRLRDLLQPERLFQVVHPSLRQNFPALRALETTPNNLPQQMTSFVGRERDVRDVTSLLARSRFVSIVGTGGLGKTRLSLEVAASLVDEFPDGVWFVELAPIADPRLVAQALAGVLNVTEGGTSSLVDALIAHLRDRRMLIVLDNCEHLIEASATLARELLQASSTLRVLATSREALRVAGETVYSLPALAIPAEQRVTPETLMHSDAARLFIDRASAVQASFTATTNNAAAIATICRRVDGIPLALELAAARVRALSVDAIASRIDDRFRLLTGGDRTGLPRQRTLRALIDWSYDLLASDEATLFRRLAVFAGAFTLDGAEAVGADGDLAIEQVLDALTRLVEKSLVEREAVGDRYRMLETVRQYAQEALDKAGDRAACRTRHLQFYLAFAQRARPQIVGPQQSEWLARLDVERENFLAAHAWSCEADLASEYGLPLVSALRRYWIFRGLLELGYRVTREALACPSAQGVKAQRCEALLDAGQLGSYMGRYAEAQPYLEQCLALARELDDQVCVSAVLQPLGLTLLGRGELRAARRHLEEGLALAERMGTPREIAGALNGLAQIARTEGDLATAEPLYERVLAIARQSGDADVLSYTLLNLAMVAVARGAHRRARELLREVLEIVERSGLKPAAQSLLEVSAGLAAARHEWLEAARWFGAAEAHMAETGLHRDPADEAFLSPYIAHAREHLGAAAFAEADSDGRKLGNETVLETLRGWLQDEPTPASATAELKDRG